MAYLSNISQVRAIQWGKTYSWDIKIDGAPSPFNNWFPASSIEVSDGDGIPFTFMPARRDYKIPLMYSSGNINITYYDDDNQTLHKFFHDWFDDIYKKSGGILTLQESVKKVTILKLNTLREITDTKTYSVFPTGDNNFRGDSSSSGEPMSRSVSLVIAGEN